jgi:tRNA wybutosine-synthesizing protein 3
LFKIYIDMDFEERKQMQLNKKDKSSIGSWDKKIVGLCNKINKKKNFYTTSSCAGRVVLLRASDVKIENAFLFRSHDKIKFTELKNALFEVGQNYKGLVEFQQTSGIMHVACKTLEEAFELMNKAKLAGWKRSGVMGGRRNMVEINSTESMSFPIMDKGIILVGDDFLKLIVKIANEKLGRGWDKIGKLNGLV